MAARDATLPDLQLHDIFHNMSPSPTPLVQPEPVQNLPRSVTPEMLTEAHIAQMRSRVVELGTSSSQGSGSFSERELELVNMVRRLTDSTLVDPSQLICQAEVISHLTAQRDFLIRQTEEERGRWASQRDGWDRMAEALIAQRNKASTGLSKEEIERYCAAYESENKALREKLNDTSTRLQNLENEITKLRPILLMEPVTTATSISHNTSNLSGLPYPSIQAAAEKAKPKRKRKKEPRVPVFSTTIPDEQGPPGPEEPMVETQPMEGIEKPTSSSSFFQFQAQPILPPATQPTFTGDHYRKPSAAQIGGPLTDPPTTLEFQVSTPTPPPAPQSSAALARTIRRSSPPPGDNAAGTPTEPPTPGRFGSGPLLRKSKRSLGGPPTPFTSDARTEHLLLAARRIGRERAGIVAGYVRDRHKELEMQRQERERERMARELEREQIEKERQERLAERGAGGLSYYRRDVVEAGPSGSGEKVARGSSPQTPKRGGGHHSNADASESMSPGGPRVNMAYVMVEPAKGGTSGNGGGKGKSSQKSGSGNAPSTPQQPDAASTQQSQSQGNPSTPLSSLIDAARMMGGDEEASTSTRNGASSNTRSRKNGINGTTEKATGSGRRRGVAAVEQPEAPAPKRRRVASARAAAASKNGGGNASKNGNTEDRQDLGDSMTALHVLADQAAAFSSHDPRGKGKAREGQDEARGNAEEGEGDDYAPTSSVMPPKRTRKGRAVAKDKEKEKEKPKPKPATTRKPRGKAALAAAAATAAAAAPRLISPPGSSIDTGGTIEEATSTTNNQFRPISSWGMRGGAVGEEQVPTSIVPDQLESGEGEAQGAPQAPPGLAPPVEIPHSRSPIPADIAPQDTVSGTPQEAPEDRQGSDTAKDAPRSTPLLTDTGTIDVPDAPQSEEAHRPMEVDTTQTTANGAQEDGTDEWDPTVEAMPQPDDTIDAEAARPEPASGADESYLPLRDADSYEDDIDAEGEVDAEGEPDLEVDSASLMLLDSTTAAPPS